MTPVITSIGQFSLETVSLLQGDMDKEYVKLIRLDKYIGYMAVVSILSLPALLALMIILKSSQVNWTTIFVFVLLVQSSIVMMGKINKLKIDVIKLASLSPEKIKSIS